MGGNQEMLFTSTMPTHTKKNGVLVGMPPPANCMQQIVTDALPVCLPGCAPGEPWSALVRVAPPLPY